MVMWVTLLAPMGSLSSIFIAIQESPNKDQLAGMITNVLAASTLFRYFSCMSKFLQTCENLQLDLTTMTAIQRLDIFLIGSKRTGLDPGMTLTALIWFHSHAGIAMFELFSHSLILSWRHSKVSRDRKEALPLPLYVVIQWDRQLLQAGCTSTGRLVLGGFILMIWSGLRFAGLQRITLKSLMTSFSEIQGLCWRPVISSRGPQWDLLAAGFLSRRDFHGPGNGCDTGTIILAHNHLRTQPS